MTAVTCRVYWVSEQELLPETWAHSQRFQWFQELEVLEIRLFESNKRLGRSHNPNVLSKKVTASMWGLLHTKHQVAVVSITKGSRDIQPSTRRWIRLCQHRPRKSCLCSIPGLQWSQRRVGKTRSWLWFTAMEAHQRGLDKIFSFSFFDDACNVAGFSSAPPAWLPGGSCCRDRAETWTRRRRFGADSFSIVSSALYIFIL